MQQSSTMFADADQGVMDVIETWPFVRVVLPTAQHEFINGTRGVFWGWESISCKGQHKVSRHISTSVIILKMELQKPKVGIGRDRSQHFLNTDELCCIELVTALQFSLVFSSTSRNAYSTLLPKK